MRASCPAAVRFAPCLLMLAGCLDFAPANQFPCERDSECASGRGCIEGVCQLRPVDGGTECSDRSECEPVLAGGCRVSPECSGVPARCQYSDAALGTRCSQPSDPVGVASGYCSQGVCDACLVSAHCPSDKTCASGKCLDAVSAIACLADADCPSHQCECADALCQSRVCAAATCMCKFGEAGSCELPLGDGVRDPQDCDGTSEHCVGGACQVIAVSGCVSDADCAGGQCECADSICATRACTLQSCLCRYGPGGACVTPLNSGVHDPGDCSDANSCYGGVCLRNGGQSCAADEECGSHHCECADATCSTRACAAHDCLCSYGAGGACVSILADGAVDGEDCANGNACYGGVCNGAIGTECSANADCGTGHCECADASCQSRVCAAQTCTCKYGADGLCQSSLAPFTVDPGDCEGVNECAADGRCAHRSGTGCSQDTECSGTCECADQSCSSRKCSPVDCAPCRVNADSDSSCEGSVSDRSADAACATGICLAGGCAVPPGGECSSDAQCAFGTCECGDATCSYRVCADGPCSCQYAVNGQCSQSIASGYDDAHSTCEDGTVCDGGGVCRYRTGAYCGGDGDCLSGNCECAGRYCMYTVCSASDCPCQYNAGGVGACDDSVEPGVLNAQGTCYCSGYSGGDDGC